MATQTPLHPAAERAGAVFVEDAGWLVPAHFGDPDTEYRQARSGAVLFDLSHHGKVEVTGADAAAFLHNLTSNDIRNLPPGTGCEAFLLTAKARVVASALIFHTRRADGGSSFWLDLAPGLEEKTLRHLDHFLISEQVEFTDHTRDLAQLHLAGPEAPTLLRQVFADAVPDLEPLHHVWITWQGKECQVRRQDSLGLPGYDILCPRDLAEALWQALTRAGASPAGLQTYQTLRVEAGTPAYGADIDDHTFAPDIGRATRAISYTKGCYLGQEPVVMARDRGQVNRTLLGLRLPGGPVPPGSLLYRDGKEVGRVTSSVLSPALGAIALAYVRRGSQEPGTVLEVEVQGERRRAQVAALPLTP